MSQLIWHPCHTGTAGKGNRPRVRIDGRGPCGPRADLRVFAQSSGGGAEVAHCQLVIRRRQQEAIVGTHAIGGTLVILLKAGAGEVVTFRIGSDPQEIILCRIVAGDRPFAAVGCQRKPVRQICGLEILCRHGRCAIHLFKTAGSILIKQPRLNAGDVTRTVLSQILAHQRTEI